MAKDPITPMGGSTHDPTKGLQERNLGNLMKILGKKEATAALSALGDMDASTWTQVKDTVSDLKDVVTMGGVGTIISNLKETIELQFDQALAPITNQLNAIITDVLNPILTKLNDLALDIADFIAGNTTGAFFGAMLGSIKGPIGAVVGAVIGAGIENDIKDLILEIEKVDDILGIIKIIGVFFGIPIPPEYGGGLPYGHIPIGPFPIPEDEF